MTSDTKTHKSRARIEDVAEAAGVSIMSVSRAMRGVEGVSQATRQRILEAAEILRYSPSSVAGALATANSSLIGVSVPTLEDSVFADIFSAMRSTFERNRFQTVFDTTQYEVANEEAWVERMLAWRAAGVVLSGVDHSEKTRRLLQRANITTLEIWSFTHNPIDLCIGIDHFDAGYRMGVEMVKLGYRKPAYIGPEAVLDRRAEQRREGFQQAFHEEGLPMLPKTITAGKHSFEGGRMGTSALLDERYRELDLIYYLNDHMALGGLEECRARGLKVPDEMGIVGFNGLQVNDVLAQPITTSFSPRKAMGEQGARMLIGGIKGVQQKNAIVLETEIMLGATTRQRVP